MTSSLFRGFAAVTLLAATVAWSEEHDAAFDVQAIAELELQAFKDRLSEEFAAGYSGRLNDLATYLRTEAPRPVDGWSRLREFYRQFESHYSELTDEQKYRLKRQLRNDIQDHPGRITPRTMLVQTFIHDAWGFRGGGFAYRVTDEGWKGFSENLGHAKRHALDALEVEEQDPQLFAFLITITGGLSGPEEEMFRYAREGLRLDPRYLDVTFRLANFLLPRWGGMPGDQRRVAEWCVDETREILGEALYIYPAMVSSDRDGPESVFRDHDFDLDRLVASYEDWAEHVLQDDGMDHFLALLLCVAGEREAARDRLGSLSTTSGGWVWTAEAYAHWQAWANGDAPPLRAQAIHAAAKSGYPERIEEAVAQGADLDAMDPTGKRPINWAVWSNQYPAMAYLIHRDIDVTRDSADLREAMTLAVRHVDVATVNRGIDRGFRFAETEALGWASYEGHEELVRLLVEKGGGDIERPLWGGARALHQAAIQGHAHIVTYLLDQGADIDATTNRGRTAVVSAAIGGHAAIIELLILRGADLGIEDAGRKAIIEAAQAGHGDALRVLFAHADFDVNAPGEDGHTLLHNAARAGHTECVQAIVEHPDCDVDAKDENGETALAVAVVHGREHAAAALINHGADPRATDRDGRAVLDIAREKRLPLAMTLLDMRLRQE